jgi:alkylated DNA nucleotide flippase Atl1
MITKKKLTKEKVYEKVKQIPKGRFSTYKYVAKSLETKAYQFIGNCLRNHDCKLGDRENIIVPSDEVCCYRVIKHDFSIGKYLFSKVGDKFEAKKKKLEEEGIRFKKKGDK